MAERRMLHKKVGVSADLAALDAKYGPRAVLFYTWLIPHLDRWGCATSDPRSLLGTVGPLWPREVTEKEVRLWVAWLVRRGLLERVTGRSGEHGIRVPKFEKHQAGTKWEREAPSAFEPDEITRKWKRTRPKGGDMQDGPGPVPDQVRTRSRSGPAQRKGREGTSRPSPSPTPSPKRGESAAAPPEPEPGAQSPPPGVNGHDADERVDLDVIEAALPASVRGAVRRGRRTAGAGGGG